MNLKVGDKVKVIAGSSKGKEGKIIKTLRSSNRVIVEGANIVKKHRKGNVIIDPKTKKTTRIGHETLENGKKVRVAKKSNEKID